MAGRIRTMKPEILDDEKTAGLTDAEFRMFSGIILLSDDHGSFRANPRWLASQIWWDREPSQDPRECLATLSRLGLVTLYENAGQVYGHVTNWSKHQKVDKPSKPRLPQINDECSRALACGCVTVCATDSRDCREIPDTDLRSPISDPDPDLRPTSGGCGSDEPEPAPADSTAEGNEPGQDSESKPPPPEPKPKQPMTERMKQQALKPGEQAMLGWERWTTLYASSKRGYGEYVRHPEDGKAMKRVVSHAKDVGLGELRRRNKPQSGLDAVMLQLLDHWFKAYLRDDGDRDFLANHCHGLRWIAHDIPKYGTPWSKDRTVDQSDVAQIPDAFDDDPAKAQAEYQRQRQAMFGGAS